MEIGAALKNIIAIGAGICQGLGLGNNSIAALITRGLAEITRWPSPWAANPEHCPDWRGWGILVLTCTGELSRNRSVGIQVGQRAKAGRNRKRR